MALGPAGQTSLDEFVHMSNDCVVSNEGAVLTTHLVLLHHSLYLVVDLASIVGHSKVWLLAELVPAYVGVLAELLLQTNPKCPWFGGPIETTLLRKNMFDKLNFF